MQVNALWYRTSGGGWWLLGSPLKMYENLAVGIPVVGSSLAAIREYSEVVLLADTTDEWVSAITRALDEPTIRQASQRISVAKENSWKKRVNTLDLWLQEMIAYDGAPLS